MFCKIILPSNEIHKLPAVPKTYDDLYQTALRKFKGKIPDKFYFKYKDSDDELITLSSDEDFETAIVTSEADKVKTLRIFLIPEAALANVNANCYLPNLMPASQESYSAENPLDKNIRGKNPAREPISQGYGRKQGDYPEGIDDFDINRLVEQLPGPVDRLKKSQSHPPQIENQEEMPSDRLSYDRTNFYDGSSRQVGRDIMGNPFNQDQMNVISDMLERKLKEKVEQRVHIAVNEIMGKLSEEFRTKPVKKNPYTHNPLMSKSVVPGFVSKPIIREPVIRESVTREPVVRAEKNQPDLNDYFCVNCKKKIEDVKYSCLDCANFDLCDQCEEKVDHAHSLLKTRLNKKTRPSMDLSDVSSVSQHQGVPTSQSTQDAGRYSSLMVSNKSQSNSYMKEEAGSFSANKNMANSSVAPGANQMIRFSNSMANINLPDKAETHNPYQAKNMSTFWNKNPIAMAQSMTYSKKETPKGFDTPGGEVKKYKAAIVKPPIYDLINVKPGHIYRVEFTIKNNGTEAWPETIKLLCINGVHKGTEEVLPALAPTEKFEVKLALKAPEEPNRYLSQWRLQYYEEGTPKPFGSNLFIEINVAEGHKSDNKKDGGKEPKDEKKEKAEKIEKVEKVEKVEKAEKAEKEVEKANANKDVNNKLEKMASPISGIKEKEKEKEKPKDNDKERVKPLEIEKPIVQANEVKERVKLAAVEEVALLEDAADKSGFTPEERRLMKEKKCSEVVLRHAQALHSIYPDIDIEKQIDFVAECPIHLDINDIVMVYSTRVDQGFGMNF